MKFRVIEYKNYWGELRRLVQKRKFLFFWLPCHYLDKIGNQFYPFKTFYTEEEFPHIEKDFDKLKEIIKTSKDRVIQKVEL